MTEELYFEDEDADEDVEYYAVRPNKTRIKKDIAEVFAMAEEISAMSEAQIATFNLPDELGKALTDAGKMPHNSARKRWLKYVTAQLRKIDIEPIKERLARIKSQSAHAVREHHQAERWRDQLLADEDNEQLTVLLTEYPNADRQHLRQLQRNAQKELKEQKTPKSARLLYKYLKELIAESTSE